MESDDVRVDRAAAAADLAALRTDRAAMAERARQPWWYDPVLGLLVFLLFAALSTGSPWWIGAGLVVVLAGARLLTWAYQRTTGFWVNGLRSGRTRKAMYVWFAAYALVVLPALVLDLGFGLRWPLVAAGAVLGVTVALVSRWWTTIYIAELREGL